MNISEMYIAISLSIFITLLIDETLGVYAGGLIVPGILALHIKNTNILLYIILLSLMTYIIVETILSKRIIIYGKRKFGIMILVSLILKITVDQLSPILPIAILNFNGIGAITPALMANTYSKQGIKYTIPVTIITSLLIYAIITILYAFL